MPFCVVASSADPEGGGGGAGGPDTLENLKLYHTGKCIRRFGGIYAY